MSRTAILLRIQEREEHVHPKPRPELLPHDALLDVAQAMALGADEHGDRWLTKTPMHHMGAALRHGYRWLAGERRDPDSGLNHLAHMAARVLMALSLDRGTTR